MHKNPVIGKWVQNLESCTAGEEWIRERNGEDDARYMSLEQNEQAYSFVLILRII